jgi:membrane fusion protein (multidrug efflux system)
MNKPLALAAALVSLAAFGGISYWAGSQRSADKQGKSQPAAPAKAGPAGAQGEGIVVETARVAVRALPQGITAVGSLRSEESVIVRPEIAGRIAEILFREGQSIAKGETIFRLDSSVQRADFERAKANETLSKSKYDRAVDLRNKGFISGQALDESDNNLKVAQADLALATARLDKSEIKAPFTGVLGLRMVSIGDFVKEGQDMVNLEQIDPLKVDFRVPEIYLSQVQPGQSLQVGLDAMPGARFEGKVLAINPLLDAAGRAVVIRAQLKNNDGKLRPGQFARVRLFTRENAEAMTVPEQAIIPAGDEFLVFRVVDGKAQRVKVELGQRREGLVEVVRGLAATDTVITAGQFKVREGTSVRAAAEPAAAPKAAGTDAPKPGKAGGAS